MMFYNTDWSIIYSSIFNPDVLNSEFISLYFIEHMFPIYRERKRDIVAVTSSPLLSAWIQLYHALKHNKLAVVQQAWALKQTNKKFKQFY